MKGIIALDIDGTTAKKGDPIPDKTLDYLEKLGKSGWKICFITGRPYSYALHAISPIEFDIALAVQNGADILHYPSRKSLHRYYISSKDVMEIVAPFYAGEENHFLVYSGYETGDFCYYDRDHFSPKMQHYLDQLSQVSDSEWEPLKNVQEEVPLVKCFGDRPFLEKIAQACSEYSTSIIHDTIDPKKSILLITAQDANKGAALDHLVDLEGVEGMKIVAGDDYNDIPMLQKADKAIVIKSAPEPVKQYAHVIGDLPENCGLVEAIKEVIE